MAESISLSGIGAQKQETESGSISLSGIESQPQFRTIDSSKGLIDVNSVLRDYDRPLVKEDFLEDERLQEIVYQSLEARSPRGRGLSRRARDVATGLTGGATFGNEFRDRPFEEVFEEWQNYQRSFNVGQSVTTANEIGYSLGQDDETLAKMGAGYLAFDAMDNAITGEGSWREMGDAVWDYARGVVYDPATLASLGIGKAVSMGASKAGTAAARKVMVNAYQRMLQRGATSRAAATAVGTAARAAPYMAPDLAINVGTDIAYQSQLIRTGAQEEYSGAQTALAAAGTMAIPALLGGIKGIGTLRKSDYLKDTISAYVDVDRAMGEQTAVEAWSQVSSRMDLDSLGERLRNKFGPDLASNLESWENLKIQAGKVVSEKGEELTDDQLMNVFERYFLFGKPVEGKGNPLQTLMKRGYSEDLGGFYNVLKDEGFVVHRTMLEDNTISGVYGEAIKLLDDETVETVIKTFEDATGRKLNLDYTAEGLSAHFIRRSSEFGRTGQIRSTLSQLERSGLKGEELARAAAGMGKVEEPKVMQFGLSVYKRLLTSHLATTGANLKGFAQLVTIDTVADFMSSAVYASQSGFAKLAGNPDKALAYGNKAWGSLMAPLRRGVSVISPDLDIDYANKVLDQNPEYMERLFRDISGDGGTREALAQFNLDPNNVLAKSVDGVTKGAQTITLVRLQDELTKRWAFAANLDTQIMKTYGMNPSQFFAREDLMAEMASDRFQDVLDRSVQRTLRETASVNWSTLPGRNGMRAVAKSVEEFTNRSAFGFVVPFGSFLNTAVATMGDLSGANLLRYSARKIGGKPVDYVDMDFGELAGKAATGWSAVALGVPAAMERIQNGLAYDQQLDADGTIRDTQYDWPRPVLEGMSQIIAHAYVGDQDLSEVDNLSAWLRDGIQNGDLELDFTQVPEGLLTEVVAQTGPTQAVRDIDTVVTGLQRTFADFQDDPDLQKFAGDLMGSVLNRTLQGVTRPLDPVNLAVGLARDGNLNPDLKQGPGIFAEGTRYINNLLPEGLAPDVPVRATPLKGQEDTPDIGRQILGNRTVRSINIAEAMHNSAGRPTWKAVRWGGPPEVKNYMDQLAAPIFEEESIRALKSNPDYFDLTTSEKGRILDSIRKNVRERVSRLMEVQGRPATLDALRMLSQEDQEKVAKVRDFLGYEGSLSEISKQEDGFEKLENIKFFVDRYDEIFFGELSLD